MITQRTYTKFLFFLFLWIGVLASAFTQGRKDSVYAETDTINVARLPSDVDWDFFDEPELLRLSVESDFKTFARLKRKGEYQKAVLKIFIDSQIVERNIRLKPRGERRLEYCQFPPIKFNFKKVDSTDMYVGDETTLKLVTHCKMGSSYQQWVLKEFLVYKMYNILTDYSFRVRLVQIDYIDTGREGKVTTKYGFLIEHLRDLAQRNDAIALGDLNISQKSVDKKMLALMGVFQYMVGNTDWSTAGPHNIKYVRLKDPSRIGPVTIPYDFDYTGIVDAEYAIAREGLGFEDVKIRYYSVWCLPRPVLEEVFAQFQEKREELYDVIENFTHIQKWQKNPMIQYLDSFYEILDSERSREKNIINACIDK